MCPYLMSEQYFLVKYELLSLSELDVSTLYLDGSLAAGLVCYLRLKIIFKFKFKY